MTRPLSEPKPFAATLKSASYLEATERSASEVTSRLVWALADEASRGWPEVRVSIDDLRSIVGRHVALHGSEVKLSPELYLVAGGLAGDPAARRILEAQYLAKVPMHVAHIVRARPGGSIEGFMAVLGARLFSRSPGPSPRLADYSGRGLLGSWLRVVAVRLAIEEGSDGWR